MSNLSCLDGLVGLKGSSKYGTSSSGLFINNLPGLEFGLFADLAKPEQLKGDNYFRDTYSQAKVELKNEFLGKLSKSVVFLDTVETMRDGYYRPDNLTELETFTGKRGVKVETYQSDRYARLFIEYIEAYVYEAFDSTVIVQDRLGNVLKEVQHKFKVGLNRVRIDLVLEDGFAYVYFKHCGTERIATKYGNRLSSNNRCEPCRFYSNYFSFWVDGVHETFDGSGIFEDSSTDNGITVALKLVCSENEILCQFKDNLASALQYKLGILILQDLKASSRTNPLVRNKREGDKVDDLLLVWAGGANLVTGSTEIGKYDKALWSAINRIKPSLGKTKCLSCGDGSLKIVNSIP